MSVEKESLRSVIMEKLRADFLATASQWQAEQADIERILRLLLTTYGDVKRHYHGLGHIQQMMNLAEQYRDDIQHWHSFYFAIWFHDFIQQNSGDNEGMSAEIAAEFLAQLNVPTEIIKYCAELILATKQHGYQPDTDMQLFVDIDLSILAADRALYKSYASKCRKEYSLPDFVYRFGRKRFLNGMLSREYIFSSNVFRQQKEQVARDNIQWELEAWL
jgi:predicted metal-dependent HD superfamily phosphohydrolase